MGKWGTRVGWGWGWSRGGAGELIIAITQDRDIIITLRSLFKGTLAHTYNLEVITINSILLRVFRKPPIPMLHRHRPFSRALKSSN